MLGAAFLPLRLRGSDTTALTARPGWYDRQVTPVLQSFSRRACTHPIHTIVFIALLASTSYLGLLDASLFERVGAGEPGKADFTSLVSGSKSLRVGQETGWKWQNEDIDVNGSTGAVSYS
jgi:hydroxymethylglutaryl-CoA reductase (NADPH)